MLKERLNENTVWYQITEIKAGRKFILYDEINNYNSLL